MSLSALSPNKIAEICNGYWLNDKMPDFVLHRAVIDSREVTANRLFIALKGAHTDGHEFLASLAGDTQHAAMVKRQMRKLTWRNYVSGMLKKDFRHWQHISPIIPRRAKLLSPVRLARPAPRI